MSLNDWQDKRQFNQEEVQQIVGEVLQKRFDHEKREKLERFRRLNRFVRPGQIVFAGSSLMEQFPIYELLLDLQLPYTIYNRGIGGYTTTELMETMPECIYDLKPAFVFINIGTNDMNGPEYRREVLLSNYEKILRGIQEHLPGTEIYTLSYYPVNPVIGKENPGIDEMLRYRTNARIQDANDGVKEMSARLGLRYVDVNAGLCDGQGNLKAEFTVEGMHMYGNGYRVVLDNLLPVLETLPKSDPNQ